MSPAGITTTLALLSILVPSQAASRSTQPSSHPVWKKLFNGRDLNGWEVVNTGAWTVEDGVIVMRRLPKDTAGGWLVTKKDFGDFILRLKFKPGNDQFNSGILIRDPGHAKTTRPALNGFEIKLAQGDRVENANGTIWYAGSAYFHSLPAQAWTTIEVKCVGDHITTCLDGRKMAETHSRRSYKGAIGLHLHGGKDNPECRWKDIEILELPEAPRGYQLMEEKLAQAPGPVESLLNQIAPTSSVPQSGWILHDGILRGEAAQTGSWFRTGRAYADFVMSFDFRLASKGDAGVSLRGPNGYEFHIADGDADNPAGSILNVGRAFMLDYTLQRVYRPQQWNHACIYAEKDHLVTYLNLQKEADVHDNRSLDGPIAFRVGPGATVEFRNVNIKRISSGNEQLRGSQGHARNF